MVRQQLHEGGYLRSRGTRTRSYIGDSPLRPHSVKSELPVALAGRYDASKFVPPAYTDELVK